MAGIVEWYTDLMENRSDPRVADWFLMSGPGSLLMIIACYLYICTKAGPEYMKNRRPYTLRKTLIAYNLIQVVLSIYMVYEGLMAGWLYDYNYRCQTVDYSDDPKALRMANVTYTYFSCKLIELLDTLFFVLRKKDRQISTLHLYHHSIMPITAWIGVKFMPGGHVTLMGVINSFVHIIMYAYYMLAALGPEVQKYLWWKKYLTVLQLVQFAIIVVHCGQTFFMDCAVPRLVMTLITLNSLLFVYMFGSFYAANYTKDAARRKKVDEMMKRK